MKKTLKILANILGLLSINKLIKLGKLTLLHPLFSIFSAYATLKTLAITRKKFPKASSKNDIEDAFQQALWCCLILMYCCKISSPQKALKWCRKITNIHQKLFSNDPLKMRIDSHNNTLGMNIFIEMLPGIHRQFFEKSFFIEILMDKVKTAKILENKDENLSNELVYIK